MGSAKYRPYRRIASPASFRPSRDFAVPRSALRRPIPQRRGRLQSTSPVTITKSLIPCQSKGKTLSSLDRNVPLYVKREPSLSWLWEWGNDGSGALRGRGSAGLCGCGRARGSRATPRSWCTTRSSPPHAGCGVVGDATGIEQGRHFLQCACKHIDDHFVLVKILRRFAVSALDGVRHSDTPKGFGTP